MGKIVSMTKDPDENPLDFGCDWSKWLGPVDTIAQSTWTIAGPDASLAKDEGLGDSKTATVTMVWVTGGTLGRTYALTNQVTTAGGRRAEQTIAIRIRPS
jgi:hypothetical protein